MEKLEQHCKNNILDFNFLTNKKINPSNTTSKQLRVLCDARFDKESRSQLVHILKTEKSSKAFVRIANQIYSNRIYTSVFMLGGHALTINKQLFDCFFHDFAEIRALVQGIL